MTGVVRLVTFVDLDGGDDPRQLSVSATLSAVLDDGRRLTLLDDRGWSASGPPDLWTRMSVDDIERTARAVVGPDEPVEGRPREAEAAGHWAYLAGRLGERGVDVAGKRLRELPHDVELSARLRARIGRT